MYKSRSVKTYSRNILYFRYLGCRGPNSDESLGRILLNLEFICIINTVSSYLRNWEKRVNFDNDIVEIQQKYKRKREKVGERKFWISVITLLKFLLTETNCGNAIAEIGEKKFCGNCGNAIAENGRKKKWLPKSRDELKKKKKLRTQYFYNKS